MIPECREDISPLKKMGGMRQENYKMNYDITYCTKKQKLNRSSRIMNIQRRKVNVLMNSKKI